MKMCCIQMLLFFIFISPCFVTSRRPLNHVFGYEGREANVSCSYDAGYEDNEKYLCRNECGNDDVLITTTEAKKNRFTIRDDINEKVFTTTISNLQYSDAGKYWCGVTRSGILADYYPAEVSLQVVKDTCCGGSTKVQSYEGGSVSITCSYESRYQNKLKYICRGNRPSTCLQQAVVSSTKKQDTRFTLTDDKLSTFTVTITSLTQHDSGSYLCGVHTNTGLDVFSAVDLEVKENSCCDSSTKVQSYEGGSVSITCSYESRYQNKLKYICRGNRPSTCLQQAVVSSTKKQDTRFTLTDDKLSTFTVNITSLTQQDSGSYLCGVHTNTSLNVFSAIDLEVKEWCCVKSNKLRGSVGRPLTMQCPYLPQHETNRKFLCKGDHHRNCTDMMTDARFTLLHDASSSSFLVMVSELEAGDAGTYWCGSDSQWSSGNYTNFQLSVDVAAFNAVVFIAPSVLVFVLIFVMVMVYKHKCHKGKATGANVETRQQQHKAGDAEEVISESDIYENQDVVECSKQRKSKQQSSASHYDAGGAEQDLYENFNTTEDIYCNEVYRNVTKR